MTYLDRRRPVAALTKNELYKANGEVPRVIADFKANRYILSGAFVSFGDIFTHSRSSTATYTDSTGDLVTVAANEPRLMHHVWDGSDYRPVGLLINADESTNFAQYSNAHSNNSGWFAAASQSGLTITRVQTGTERGVSFAEYRVEGTATGTFADQFYISGVSRNSATTGDHFSASVDIRSITDSLPAGAGILCTIVQEDAGNGFITQTTSAKASASPSAVYDRVSVSTKITNASVAQTRVAIVLSGFNSGDVIDYTFRVQALQLEDATAPTQYIPVDGSSNVTRAADVLNISSSVLTANGFSPMPSEVSIAMHWLASYTDNDTLAEQQPVRWRDSVSPNDQILWELSTKDADTGQGVFTQRASSSDYFSTTLEDDANPGIDVSLKYASRHAATELRGASSGTLASAETPTAMPDLAGVDIDVAHAGANFVVSRFLLWDVDIGDTGLVEASTA